MCIVAAPAAVAAISLAATLAGSAMSAIGQIQQGRAAAASANYQAAIGRNNQILAQRAAADARARGVEDERRLAEQGRKLIGRQRAVLAANGVVVDEGSALDITSDTAQAVKLDRMTILSNAEREALGYEAQGMNFQAESELASLRARNARSSATGAAAGTLFAGATSVASKWYQFDREGVFG